MRALIIGIALALASPAQALPLAEGGGLGGGVGRFAQDDLGPAPNQPPSSSPAATPPSPTLPQSRGKGDLPLTPARHIAFDTVEGTWLSLSVSPDGGRIVFDMLGDLYAVDAGGGAARAISRGMAFDSQPVFSPDGSRLLFVSDRSGAENLWTAAADGSDARQLTFNDSADEFISPAWSPDGRQVFASIYRPSNTLTLWRYPADGSGQGEALTKPGISALGAAPAADGRHLYVAAGPANVFEDDVTLPLWSIHRLDLTTGADETVVTNQGSAMRPALSPDGKLLAYAARLDGKTTLRLRDLATGADRLLIGEITHDVQETLPSRDLVPGYAFTPDGKAILISYGGKLQRVAVADGAAESLPFTAHVALDLGPFLRQRLTQEEGPVRARLIQDPAQSPDGKRLAFSALGRLYVTRLDGGGAPRALVAAGPPQYQPAWSPDGRSLTYVTWQSQTGGQVWRVAADGKGRPRRLTDVAAYYTGPVFSPDGRQVLALRSSAYDRLHTAQEPLWTGRNYGLLRQAELIALDAGGGPARVLASGQMSGQPQFTADAAEVFLNTDKGLEAIARDGSGARRLALTVTGPGYYFLDHHVPVDDIRISPDGRWAMVQNAQRLHLIAMPAAADAARPLDLDAPTTVHLRLTPQGADFFAWADGGRTLTWALGSSFYRRPLAGVSLLAAGQPDAPDRTPVGNNGLQAFDISVEVPRDTPHAATVLRGATAITMKGDEVIPDADVVVVDNRITAVGRRGQVAVPAGATIRDLAGRWITPGFIDVHDHFGEVRRGVLDFDDWGMRATLAYGVTSALDPSTLSIDMLAYQDALDAGMMLGPRVYSTATAVFSYNEIASLQEARDVVSRYVDHYRTRNLKEYRTGSRRVRQWIAMAAQELGSMPTTEGALDMKLDLTQVIDGFSGNEHALSAAPLYRDVVELMARSRVSYDTTMMISHGGPPGGEDFITRARPHEDAKVRALYPHFIADRDFTRVHWVDPQELFYPAVAAGAAKIARAGGVVGVGSHGNYPGIGFQWELQAYGSGGMSPHEVLRAATMGSAETIGRAGELGSLEPGKFADLVVLDRDPLADIKNAAAVRQVMKNGRLYDADTLAEVWPDPRPAPVQWFASEARPGQ